MFEQRPLNASGNHRGGTRRFCATCKLERKRAAGRRYSERVHERPAVKEYKRQWMAKRRREIAELQGDRG